MWGFLILSCLLALVSSQSSSVSQCTVQSGPLPINVNIEGCVTPPCQLPQLSDVVMHIVFRAPRTTHSMSTLVRAFLIGNIPIPYDLGDDAVTCNFLTNSYCPVLQNEVLQYTLRMYIEPIFPVGVAPTLELFVRDDEVTSNIFCIRVPVRIIAPLESTLSSVKNGNVSNVSI